MGIFNRSPELHVAVIVYTMQINFVVLMCFLGHTDTEQRNIGTSLHKMGSNGIIAQLHFTNRAHESQVSS